MMIEIDVKGALEKDQLIIVAPMRHSTKGIGYALCPITHEMLANMAPFLMEVINDTVSGMENE